MTPQQRITKESILHAAFQLVRDGGVESLNARNVAHALNCSTQPIFSYYENMADLKAEAFKEAERFHIEYLNKVELDADFFLNIGLAYIGFALDEPNLFNLLFMSDGFAGKKLSQYVLDDCTEEALRIALSLTNGSSETAESVFTDMWLYAHGIASMLATNRVDIERSELESMLRHMFDLLTGQGDTGEGRVSR